MRAREAEEDAARALLDGEEVGADALASAVALAGNLLVIRHDAGRAAEVDIEIAALNALHDAVDDVALFAAVLLDDRGALEIGRAHV